MIKRLIKRIFFILIGIFLIYVIFSNIGFFQNMVDGNNASIIIDADTGNEMDDLFAITRALLEDDIEVIGLTSAQWFNHPDATDSTVWVSQQLNDEILRNLKMTHIPHPMGANGPLRYWGNPVPNRSPAANYIIKRADELPAGEKLNVVVLGAPTNLASALILKPEIAGKIKCYLMGLKYDPMLRVWNKNEFNTRNDLDAMDYLLNNEQLEMWIMTATTSAELVFTKEEIFEVMEGKQGIWEMLVNRWKSKFPDHQEWIMWDVAIIEAIIHPDLATVREIYVPDENTQRKVHVYTRINAKSMKKDFFKTIKEYI
ncbi:MAG: nucleoside hydrolase [Bacteroidales bacterium]|nr:nucleoside hydrolase [Bacteroidales bacterium]